MAAPMLTLLVAGSIQISCDSPRQADLARIVSGIARTVPVLPGERPDAEAAPTVRDVAYHLDLLAPVPVPAAPLQVTYDWRSPVVFDVP
jgi:hypothetical protein